MDIGFIVAPCSGLGRAGSLSHAGRGTQALQVSVGEASTAQPKRTHLWARSSAAPGREGRGGDGERWAMAEGEREREATDRELSLGFQSAWLHPEGPFWELRGCWAGPCGRGCPRAGASAQVCPGAGPAPRAPDSILPSSGERKTHLITEIQKHISDTMGCYFATIQKALKSLCASE